MMRLLIGCSLLLVPCLIFLAGWFSGSVITTVQTRTQTYAGCHRPVQAETVNALYKLCACSNTVDWTNLIDECMLQDVLKMCQRAFSTLPRPTLDVCSDPWNTPNRMQHLETFLAQ